MKTIKQLEEEIDKIGRIKEKYNLREEITLLPQLFATLTQTKAIVEMIEEIEIIKDTVGEGCNTKKEMEMFRAGYKNGRKVFVSEILQKINGKEVGV